MAKPGADAWRNGERERWWRKKKEERGVERQGERVGGGEQRKVQYVIIDRGGECQQTGAPFPPNPPLVNVAAGASTEIGSPPAASDSLRCARTDPRCLP